MRRRLFNPAILPGLLTVLALLGIWELASLGYTRSFLPSLSELWGSISNVFNDQSPFGTMATTLWRVLAGLALSMLIGTAIGMAMGLRRDVENFMAGWIMVLLTFPAIAWAFLAVLWFGLRGWVPVFVVVAIVIPFVAMNAWSGTKAMDKELLDMSKAFRANRGLRIRRIILPQLMPFFFSSLRIAFAVSWKIVLIGEAFGIPSGVGRELTAWFSDLRADMILAWALMFMAVMMFIEFVVFRWWERRVFSWRHRIAT